MKKQTTTAINIALNCLLIVGLLVPQSGFAYRYWQCDGDKITWDSNPDKLRAAEVTFPSGDAYRTALGEVVSQFNLNPSRFDFDLEYDERYVRVGGSQSEVWGTNDADDHAGHDALTWLYMTCREIRVMDIVFNASSPFTSGTDKSIIDRYGGTAISFRAVLMHELGHALGLYHEGREYNLMGQGREHLHVNFGYADAYFGEDASDGAVFLYGTTDSTNEDVGVVHWKFDYEVAWDYGNYSEHTRTDLSSPEYYLTTWIEYGEPVSMVVAGYTLDVEFTLENNGKTRQRSVDVGYYLSTNEWITATSDRRLGGFVADLGRNQVWTTTRSMTIPDDVRSGRYYYLGVVVDENDEITEVDESNNATYIRKIWLIE